MSKACPREDLKHKIYMESDIEKKKLIDLVCSHPIFRDSVLPVVLNKFQVLGML